MGPRVEFYEGSSTSPYPWLCVYTPLGGAWFFVWIATQDELHAVQDALKPVMDLAERTERMYDAFDARLERARKKKHGGRR